MLLALARHQHRQCRLPTLAQRSTPPSRKFQWIVLAYLLAITTLIVGAGRLGEPHRPALLLAGIFLFTRRRSCAASRPRLGC